MPNTENLSNEETVYSRDGESYVSSKSELFDAMNANGDLAVGEKYYTGAKVQRDPSHFFSVDSLIEDMASAANDEASDFADGFPDLSKDKKEELDTLISDWLNKNLTVDFITVRDAVECVITADDVSANAYDISANTK